MWMMNYVKPKPNLVFTFATKVHAKLYVMRPVDKSTSWVYTGSQNFNFSNGNMELMIRTPLHSSIESHVDKMFSDNHNLLDLVNVNIKGTSSKPGLLKTNWFDLQRHNRTFGPGMLLVESINLREICDKNPMASLNLCHGRGRLNQSGIWITRPWYEVELTLGKQNYLGLPRDFTAFTDDGYVIQMQRRSGGPAGQPEKGLKDLTSKGNRLLFGQWIKGKLEDAGVLEVGDIIDGRVLDVYGTDQLEFYKISGTEFFMRFQPNSRQR